MKLLIACPLCVPQGTADTEAFKTVQLRQDGLYEVNCLQGHKSIFCMRNPNFEMLFQSGLWALIDGYPREAVSSIAAALERFYEFYLEVIALKHSVNDSELKQAWKIASKQSERQLGAFLFLYLFENHRAVDFSAVNKTVEFRNKVIHQGNIATQDEVIKYGETVLDFIFTVLNELLSTSESVVDAVIEKQVEEKLANVTEDIQLVHYTVSTVINITSGVPPLQKRSFGEAVERLLRDRQHYP